MPLRDQKERERREMRTEFDGIIAQIKALQSQVDQKIREYRDLKADRDSIREELNVGLPADLQALQEELTVCCVFVSFSVDVLIRVGIDP